MPGFPEMTMKGSLVEVAAPYVRAIVSQVGISKAGNSTRHWTQRVRGGTPSIDFSVSNLSERLDVNSAISSTGTDIAVSHPIARSSAIPTAVVPFSMDSEKSRTERRNSRPGGLTIAAHVPKKTKTPTPKKILKARSAFDPLSVSLDSGTWEACRITDRPISGESG